VLHSRQRKLHFLNCPFNDQKVVNLEPDFQGTGKPLALRSCSLGPVWVISVARISESVAARYGAWPATTPMLATVSPFFIEGTAQTYRTTPLDGARASHTVLPNRSVT
jgi:hypothetical protein